MKPTDTQAAGLLARIGALAADLNNDAREVLTRGASGGSPQSAVGRPQATGLGGGAGGSELTATERAADRWFPRTDDTDKTSDGKTKANVLGPPVGFGADPVRRDALLFAQCIRDAAALLERADACRRAVLHPEAVGRAVSVDLCAWCDQPAPTVRRVDGRPYHPGLCQQRAAAARDNKHRQVS